MNLADIANHMIELIGNSDHCFLDDTGDFREYALYNLGVEITDKQAEMVQKASMSYLKGINNGLYFGSDTYYDMVVRPLEKHEVLVLDASKSMH